MRSLLFLCLLGLKSFGAGFDSGKTEFVATYSSTDDSTNVITTIAVPTNSIIRIEVRVLGNAVGDSAGQYGASYSIAGTFRHDGTNAVWMGSAITGTQESFPKFTAILDGDSSGARIRVAGDVGKPLNWIACVTVYYH